MRPAQVLLLIVLGMAAASGARAQTVRAVEFRGLHLLAEETLRFYLGLEEGRELDETALDRNLRELWERRLIDDIRVDKEAVEGGVRLIVTVVERPILRSIDYQGLKRLSQTDINERIAKDQVDVREGDPLDLGEVKRLEAAIEEMYRDKGYRFADARWTVEEVSPSERRVLFQIDEAEKVRIGAIRFEGNDVFGDRRLRWAMKDTKKTNIITRIMKKDIYNPATLDEDLVKVRDVYRAAGYKNARLGEPRLSVIGQGGRRRLGIEVPIEEGERFKLGEISIEGNEKFTDQALLRQFERPRGGWLRAKVVDDGLEKVRELYRNYGHIFSEVDSELREREGEDNVADLMIRITEGDQYTVGRLEFEGNTRTRDKVLRREFRVQEGTLLNMGAVKSSLFKINQLGYFKLDEDEPISFVNFDSEKKTVELQVHGEEADRTELQVGGGYSEGYGWFGQLSVKTQNFLGRGEVVGVAFQSGRYSDEFDVSYFVPWFLDKPQSIGLQVFNNELDYSQLTSQDYSRKAQGAVVTYGRSLGLFGNVSVSYTRSDLQGVSTTLGLGGEPIRIETDLSNSSLRPAFVYESRDNRFEPTTGARLAASIEYAGGVLGGDNYFYRPEISASWFKPVSRLPVRTVFAINAEVGHIEPYDDDYPLDYFERYFMGGENSIRGFRFRTLSVRCLGGEPLPIRPSDPVCHPDEVFRDQFGRVVGGESFVQLNLEYHLLVGGPFRILGFVDGAQVYGEDQSIDVGRMRWTAGAELRVFVPVFGAPLRFIYASNLEPLPEDRFESFQFSIGATF
jgi:outer membrane protein insertion porin family